MPSTVTNTATIGGHFHITVLHPSGKVVVPRFRNVVLPGFADLPTSQAAMQAAATALVDSVTPKGPNATAYILGAR